MNNVTAAPTFKTTTPEVLDQGKQNLIMILSVVFVLLVVVFGVLATVGYYYLMRFRKKKKAQKEGEGGEGLGSSAADSTVDSVEDTTIGSSVKGSSSSVQTEPAQKKESKVGDKIKSTTKKS